MTGERGAATKDRGGDAAKGEVPSAGEVLSRPPTPRRCLLVRHGETEWSRTGRHTGRTDVPLTDEGRAQATALAPRLAAELAGGPVPVVLTSPLSRAADTCALAGLGGGAETDVDLVEWDYGSYEGRTTAEIVAGRPGWNLFTDGAPGGEQPGDVGARVDRVLERIRAVEGVVVCVAHAHVLRVLAARWIGAEPVWGQAFVLAPTSVSELGWEHGRPVVCRWNVT